MPQTYRLASDYYGRFCFTPLAAQPQYFQISFTSLHKTGGLSYFVSMTSKPKSHNYIFRHNESCHETIPLEQARRIWRHLVAEGWKPE